MCLTDAGETRCHVAFKNFGRLGTSAVFIVLFVRASIFSSTARSFIFGLDSRFPSPRTEPADVNDEARFDDLPRIFSFRTESIYF